MAQWHISVPHLRLVNFRLFENLDIDLDARLCVFLGDNGSGKTSVIEALAILLSRIFPHCRFAPRLHALPYAADLVRVWGSVYNRRYKQDSAETSAAVGGLVAKTLDGNSMWAWGLSDGVNTFTQGRYDCGSAEEEIAKVLNDRQAPAAGIPVFARYGADRISLQGTLTEKTPKLPDATNPFAAYVDALQPNIDFSAFLNWFDAEEVIELRETRRNPAYISPELQAVRDALERVFAGSPMKPHSPRIEAEPKRFVMSCAQEGGEEVELEFCQLSDGYRSMVALVADFARRLAIANRYVGGNPLDGPGVLMIDEVDAHLHPKWQYRVIQDLQRTFPNVQLIVTTHSPEVVSTVDKKHVYILESVDGVQQVRHPEQQTDGDYPENIASMVMGADSVVASHPAFLAYLDCLGAIQADTVDTEAYRAAYAKAAAHYGENHAFIREIDARLAGLERRRSLRARLKAGK